MADKKTRKKPGSNAKLFSRSLRKKVILIAILVICFLTIIWLLRPVALRFLYSAGLPSLPDLSGYSPPVTEFIQEHYAAAAETPYSDETVGKLAMAYHANFFYDDALTCYAAAMNLNGEQWLWPYYMALIMEELGDIAKSIIYLNNVVEINPRVTYAWFRLGNAYLKQHSLKAAESAFNRALDAHPFIYDLKLPENEAFPLAVYTQLNLARVFMQQEQPDRAKTILLHLVQEHPDFGAAYRLLGQLFSALGDTVQGEEYAIRAGDFEGYVPPSDPMFNQLILNARDSGFILKHIDIALKGNNFDWAAYLCRFILQYDPEDIAATEKYINVLLLKYEHDDLENELDRYYNFYFENDKKLVSMAETLYLRNQHQYALKFLQRALILNGSAIEAHILYLKTLVSLRLDDTALNHCEKALAVGLNSSELRTEYGRILALHGREKEAREQLNLALELNPENEVTLILLGVMSQEQGHLTAALNYYQKSIDVNPLNVNSILKLGNLLLEMRKWKQALKLFQESLKASPNDVDLLERYAWIQAACPDSRFRNGEKALALAERISMVRKKTYRQDLQCNITFAVAYAENGAFDSALGLVKNALRRAKKQQLENYIPQIQKMIALFESGKPYRM